MAWRVLARALIAAGLFAAIKAHGPDARLAAGLAAFVLCDPGMMFGQLIRHPLSCRLVEFNSKADDAQLDGRLILINGYLSGVGREEMRRSVGLPAGSPGWEAAAMRWPGLAALQRDRPLAQIDSVWADPRPRIGRFEVDWVVLPAGDAALHLDGLARPGPTGPHDRAWRVVAVR